MIELEFGGGMISTIIRRGGRAVRRGTVWTVGGVRGGGVRKDTTKSMSQKKEQGTTPSSSQRRRVVHFRQAHPRPYY
jgi:hypothetical protein